MENAFKKMHKKDKGGGRGRTVQYTDELRPFLIETKFDGNLHFLWGARLY